REVHKPIVERRGFFITGKFDQFNRDAPYTAVIAAFRSLIRQILSENNATVEAWKKRLLAALGANSRIAIDVIPEVQLIIGDQPEVAQLPPSEAQNRFNLVFLQFVQAFAGAAHPLVLVLDDLQWADIPSLKLLEILLSDKDTGYLLVIGAYRDNETGPTHPLRRTISTLKEYEGLVGEITLQPLQPEVLNQLTADTLQRSVEEIRPLSDLLLRKTSGNPFFVNEFLKSLYTDHLVVYNYTSGRWDWDIERIEERNITDNVVELMRGKIGLLAEKTRELCQYAACVGNKFDLQTLSTVFEKSAHETARCLWPAILEGLILPVGNTYKLAEIENSVLDPASVEYRFLHDQVQNAAYALLEEQAKKELHLRIGRLLLNSFSEEEKQARIFELVTQFNNGAALLETESEKIAVAQINLTAGKKAKNSAAYEPAYRYFKAGIGLLPSDTWQRHYDFTLDLMNEAAESAYLSGETEEMERLTAIVFSNAAGLLDQVKAYSIKIQGYLSQTRNEEALNTSLEILGKLGADFPKAPNKLHIVRSLIGTKLRLRGKSADYLVAQHDMVDPNSAAIMEILPHAASASYFAQPNLFPLIVFKQVNLSVRYGNHIQSAFAYATYGLVMCGSTLEFDEGLKYGAISVRLLDKFKTAAVYTKIHYIHSNFIVHWRYHFRDTLDEMTDSYYKGLETGDFLFSSYAAFNICTVEFYMGNPLPDLKRLMDDYASALRKIRQQIGLGWLNIYRQTVCNLMNDEADSRLAGAEFNEEIQVAEHEKGKDFSGLCVYYMNRMMLAYLFDQTEEAIENGERSFALIDNVIAGPHVSPIHFYYGLTLLRAADEMPKKRGRNLRRAGSMLQKIKKFAKSAPENNLAKQYLMEAELHRIRKNNQRAAALYQQAIETSRKNGFLHEEAMANELAARFWETNRDSEQSLRHLLEARRLYQKWGATAKVNLLDRKYSLKKSGRPFSTEKTISRTGFQTSSEIDMLSLTKAALAISGEIQLGKLMSQLMHVVVENAGAQNGFFVIERDGQWQIEAQGSVEEGEESAWTGVPLEGNSFVPESVIQFVARTREDLVIPDVQRDDRFANDAIVRQKRTRSLICLPVIHQGTLIGMLYAENNLNSGVFTEQRVQFLKLLSGQVAVSLENALQYERLEQKVAERTAEVRRQKEALEKSLSELKMAQAKLVESEKMASLGQLTAGLAHEINNPINFVSVGVNNLRQNFEELKTALQSYLVLDPAEDNREALQKIADRKLHRHIADTVEDSDEMFRSIQNGITRTVTIVKSLRNFSRLDEGDFKVVDLHEGLDSTLEILQSQIKKKAEVIRNYGELPKVECAAGKINQVFMNIINNALQAMDEPGTITITTRYLPEQNEVSVSISDSGAGMSETVKNRLFEPFFTTKPVGEGTGLGLSISYGIINDHNGRIEVESEPGKGATFTVYLPASH
ncbi:MAG: AAA family ATPase, partial [Saprospiraceae bacterium]|nr:AAA family ATPase [Saprospiraceae bacterium]